MARENVQRIPLNLHYRAHETATKRRPWMSGIFVTYWKMKGTSCNYCSVFDSCCVHLEWDILHFSLIIYDIKPLSSIMEITRTTHTCLLTLLLILFEKVPSVYAHIEGEVLSMKIIVTTTSRWYLKSGKPAFSCRHGHSTTSIRSMSSASRHVSWLCDHNGQLSRRSTFIDPSRIGLYAETGLFRWGSHIRTTN